MYNNKLVKIAYTFIMLLVLIAVVFVDTQMVFAATKSELEDQESEIDQQIEETSSEIAGVKSQMSTELTQINKLNTQIAEYESELEELEDEIATLTAEVEEQQSALDEKVAEYEENQERIKKRLVALYEAGTTSYLDMLLSSTSLSDFISKYYLISELAECDSELLQSIQSSKNEITVQRATLNSKKEELEQAQETAERKKNTLNLTVSEKTTLVSNLSEEEAALEEQLEQFEQDKKAIQQQIAALAAKSGTVATSEPSAYGYISPLAGKTKNNITTGYYGYSGHTGVDFACSAGTPVLAVKSGTVVTSTALVTSSGAYRSYGEYIIINHNDGTMTLYAHMLAGSRTVSAGDTVVQGQQIGQVGSTGNSTGNHLHFEVFVNGSRVNPTSYLP